MNKPYVPIYEKVALTIEEAAEYSNIGQNRISNLLKEPRCPFVLYVGAKKLVKRKEFERFISENIEISEIGDLEIGDEMEIEYSQR